ncbi:MAG: BatD family protein [Candidatus Margulisbacteria bacterium]|nr:BatD family protein [Candidatus Margulisiibacteriota bacterium]
MKIRIGSLILLLIFNWTFAEMSVQARVDRKQIAVNETLTFTLEASGDKDLPNLTLPPLDDFIVIGTSRVSRVSIINGQVSKVLESNYTLSPKREGDLSIPSMTINIDGKKILTERIIVNVSKAVAQTNQQKDIQSGQQNVQQSASNIFLEAETAKKKYYQGEPIIYVLKFYNRLPLFGQPNLKEAQLINLTRASKLETNNNSYKKIIQGRNYMVNELSSVYYPLDTGKASFDSAIIAYSVSPFEPNYEVRSNQVNLNVVSIPSHNNFGQGVGHFTISVVLDKDNVLMNEGFYYRIVISGYGNLRLATLPDIRLPSDVERFDPKVTLEEKFTTDGVKAQKTFEFLFIPRSAGKITIPQLEWTYFDPNFEKFITLQAPARIVNIKHGKYKDKTSLNMVMQQSVQKENEDIYYIKMGLGPIYNINGQKLKIYVLLIIIILFVTGFFYNSLLVIKNLWFTQSPENHFNKSIRNIIDGEQFYNLLYSALTAYIAEKKKIKIGEVNHKLLESYFSGKKTGPEIINSLHYFEDKKFRPQTEVDRELIKNDYQTALKLFKQMRDIL